MNRNRAITQQREARAVRVRQTLRGSAERPRLSVFRSEKHIRCQIIDDTTGHTLVAAGTDAAPLKGVVVKTWGREAATAVGKRIAELAREKGIAKVRFDRGSYKFHGRVKALAEAARKDGLSF